MIPFKYIVMSDLHLGHRKAPTEQIVRNIRKTMSDNSQELSDINAVFIAGDLFDRIIEWRSEDAVHITLFVTWLVKWCSNRKVLLRILEGTPSHDWKQTNQLAVTIDSLKLDIDFKFIKKLELEYLTKFDKHILYVPDEWNKKSKTTYDEVIELLSHSPKKEIDLAIMHGYFQYQVPQMPESESSHDFFDYERLVKYWINIGHIHKFNPKGKVIPQGSVDRLAHNEEGPKGFVVMSINSDNTKGYKFIENKDAIIFKTIHLRYTDAEMAVKFLDKRILDLPANSHVRIRVKKNNPIRQNQNTIKTRYSMYHIRIVADDDDVKDNSEMLSLSKTVIETNSVQLTKDNISKILIERLNEKNIPFDANMLNEELTNIL